MSRFILTSAEMRSAEDEAISEGTPAALLMERAGAAAAEAIARFAGTVPALVLCGPGNNGGDGYVIARRLAERGSKVRVAALAEPATAEARAARSSWTGPVEEISGASAEPLLVDALFGTGLARPLDEALSGRLAFLAAQARVRVAVDLPSGVSTDDGAILSPIPHFDMTVTFAALKPSHLLQPAARHMGRLAIADIGIEAESRLAAIGRPRLRGPGPDDHKYRRGFVAVQAGAMPGAAALTAAAAARSGAGYVRIASAEPVAGVPSAVVQSPGLGWTSDDPRIGAIAIGPGLGSREGAWAALEAALASPAPLVIDADALAHLAERGIERLHGTAQLAVLTPHSGEFERLFPALQGSKVEKARAAAAHARAVVVFKGADTVVAAPDGRAAIARNAPNWLATAGTGDVLAGVIAAIRAQGLEAFEAACAGVWLHGRSAELAGPGLIADDLLERLAEALAECL
ncbi:MAG TPA: NAD(P)H-hydrate dehydratase [Allosphingosinicella sp.]|nr:NAD(P)H-hydrate dehydratase [Allosphingosinicella sp.]